MWHDFWVAPHTMHISLFKRLLLHQRWMQFWHLLIRRSQVKSYDWNNLSEDLFLFLKIYLSRYLREIAALQGEDIRRHFAREGYLYGAAAGVFLRCFVDCLYVVLAYKKCSQQATADKETTVIWQVLIKFTITASVSVTAHASCCIFCRGRELTLNDQSQGSTITLNMTHL